MNDNLEQTQATTEVSVDAGAKKSEQKLEPLFHISKRASISLSKSIGIRVSAIVLALIFAGLVTLLILKQNPVVAYATMFSGVFGANTMVSLKAPQSFFALRLRLPLLLRCASGIPEPKVRCLQVRLLPLSACTTFTSFPRPCSLRL